MLSDLVARSSGMSLEELLSRLNAEKGGRWTHRLEELEQCGFVRRHGCARGMTVRSHVLSFLFIETADALMAFLV